MITDDQEQSQAHNNAHCPFTLIFHCRIINQFIFESIFTSFRTSRRATYYSLAPIFNFKARTANIPFASQSNNRPIISILICLFLNFCRERNSTHDTIPKFLVQHSLIRIAIILDNLIQAVNKWFFRRHFNRATSVRKAAQLLLKGRQRDFQHFGELLDIFWGSLGLAVEDGGSSYFITANVVGNFFKADTFFGFRFEEGFGGFGEVRVLGCLVVKTVSCETA